MEVSEIKEGRLAGWQMDECAGWRKYLRFFLGEACRCDGAGNITRVCRVLLSDLCISHLCQCNLGGPRQARSEGRRERQSVGMLIHLLRYMWEMEECAQK